MISERDYIAIASRVKCDPITGLFTWAVSCGKISKGDIANYHNDAGYITLGKKRLRAHRVAWFIHYGYVPEYEIDHINNIRDDNRISNLREASDCENARNTKISKSNTSGYKGVHFCKYTGKWRATVKMYGKSYHLGRFSDKEAAHKAYCKKVDELFLEFANHG
ncbi:HNH endonuclease [Salmonella enterica]|nr:HNH endonuclease [Salmonella enterica]